MSLMLKRGIEALVGTALVVAIQLAVFPVVAEAQSTVKGGAAATAERSVVVEPGDSLWSISAERLGPGASAQQIAKGTERIYALNRDRIGADPNLIIVGQRLSLLQTMGGRVSAATPEAGATTTTITAPSAPREGAGRAAAESDSKKRHADHAPATEEGNSQASRTRVEVGKQSVANKAKAEEEAPAAAGNEPPHLPKAPEGDDAAPAVPAVRQVASEEDSSTTSSPLAPLLGSVRSVVGSASSAVGETFAEVRAAAPSEPRTTLGWIVMGLSVVVGALIAWKLPMRRTTRREAERWASYGHYGGNRYTSNSVNLAMPTVERDERRQRAPHELPARPAPAALEGGGTNGSKTNGSRTKRPKVVRHALAGGAPRTGLAKRRRLGRAAARGSGQSVVRSGLVTGVTRAEVHHVLRVPPKRRRRHHKPLNGGIQAVRRRAGKRR